jgi:hypothetical protein
LIAPSYDLTFCSSKNSYFDPTSCVSYSSR